MITLARIIEAWRDAQIFKNPTAPRGFWWHALKYPQFGLLIGSGLFYFIIYDAVKIKFPQIVINGFGEEVTFLFSLVRTALVILSDVLMAWAAFEFFLRKFREE